MLRCYALLRGVVTLMEWYSCPDCTFNHPWDVRDGKRACLNIGLTREDVLRTAERIASGKVVDVSKAPLSERKRVQARERMRRMRARIKGVE